MSDEKLPKFNGPNWNLYIFCHDGDYFFQLYILSRKIMINA
jgi:hypothetical protein